MEQNKYIPIIRLSAIVSIVLGVLVITGWLFRIEHFQIVIDELTKMKFNTALCFLLLGISLLLMTFEGKYKPLYSSVLSSIILLLFAAITLSEDIFNVNPGFDEFFVKDTSFISGNVFPGRMAPSTAVCFILMAFSLLNIKSKENTIQINVQYILHLVSLISFTALLGYLYNVPSFYKISFLVSMAAPTALAFFLLSITASLINPLKGLTSVFSGIGIGNIMARRLFPLVGLLILVLGYLCLESNRLNWVSVEFGIALFALALFCLSLLMIANTVGHLNRIDQKRNQAEYSLKMLNKTLEEKVKERTKDLKESEGKFYEIFKMSPAGLTMSDLTTGRFLDVNQSFLDLTGYCKEEAEGKTAVSLGVISSEGSNKITQLINEQGFLKNLETYYYTKSGEKRNTLMSIEIIAIGDRKIALTVLYDITVQKNAEQKLKEAIRIAEESSVAKERFMANMSHEIRTPMNAIIGFTNLIECTTLDVEQSQYLGFIKTSSENLLVLINDILDFSKIEAGMMHIEKVPFKIKDLLHSIEIMFSEKAKEKSLKLVTEIDGNVSDILIGDPTRLTQILINLIGNAIKFTSQGSVNVFIRLLSVEDQHAQISIAVRDTGIGIPTDKQKEIFERFTQASSETTRNYGGTGLGLSIVKRLVELQKGDITVKSIDGEGTEFEIVLPYVVGENILMDEAAIIPNMELNKFQKELKILLAEDNLMNQILGKSVV